MTIRFDEAMRAMWYVDWENGNWLGALRELEDEFEFKFRWRYIVDDRLDSFSDDKKSWYEAHTKKDNTTLQEAIAKITATVEIIHMAMGGKVPIYELIRGDMPFEEFIEKFREQPFAHVEIIPSKEEMN